VSTLLLATAMGTTDDGYNYYHPRWVQLQEGLLYPIYNTVPLGGALELVLLNQ